MSKIICDASSLISFSENCLLCVLREISKDIIITPSVEKEIVDYPYHTKRFKLRAIQLKNLIKDGTIRVMEHEKLREDTDRITEKANSLLKMQGRRIKIMHEGESECIALYNLIKADALLIDERTARHLVEDPEKIREYMQSRMSRKITIDDKTKKELISEIGNISIIRSSEIIAYAYENRLLRKCGMENALEAALYAVKFAGCSITEEEISEYVKMLG